MSTAKAFSVDRLTSEFGSRGGFARTDRYVVQINSPFPAGSGGRSFNVGAYSDFTSLACKEINLPRKSFAGNESTIYGLKKTVPYATEYETVTMKFQESGDFTCRNFMESWQNKCISPKNQNTNYYKNYVGTIQIGVLSEQHHENPSAAMQEAGYMVTLFEAWPEEITEIQLTWESTELFNFDATIRYKYWESNFTRHYDNPRAGEARTVATTEGSMSILGKKQ